MTATLRATFLSVVVVGLLAACGVEASQELGDPGPVPTLPPPPTANTVAPPPPTTEAPTTTTTELPRLDAADFSPCDLLPDSIDGEPLLLDEASRYLASEFPSVDRCLAYTADFEMSIDVGYVAYGSLDFDDLMADVDRITEIPDLGDESGFGKSSDTSWTGAVTGPDYQVVMAIYDAPGVLDEAYIRQELMAVDDEMPARPPAGGEVLPDACGELDRDLIEGVSGDVVLARGGDVEGALSCGYLGEDGDAVLITVIQNPGAVDTVRRLGERDGWRRLGAGKLAYVTETNERIYVAIDDDTLVYLETMAADPPAAGSPIDEDRQALLDDVLVFAAFL